MTQSDHIDMAENYLPNAERLGRGPGLRVLVAMLLVLLVTIQLILRTRDVH